MVLRRDMVFLSQVEMSVAAAAVDEADRIEAGAHGA